MFRNTQQDKRPPQSTMLKIHEWCHKGFRFSFLCSTVTGDAHQKKNWSKGEVLIASSPYQGTFRQVMYHSLSTLSAKTSLTAV